MMEGSEYAEEVTFHGFTENDEVKAVVQEKLEKLQKLTSSVRRPVNRFLKRKEMSSSPSTVLPISDKVQATNVSPPVTNVMVETPANFKEEDIHLAETQLIEIDEESNFDDAAVTISGKVEDNSLVGQEIQPASSGSRPHRFLKVNSAKTSFKKGSLEHSISASEEEKPRVLPVLIPSTKTSAPEVPVPKVKPNLIRMPVSQPSVPLVETGVAAVAELASDPDLETEPYQVEDMEMVESNHLAEEEEVTHQGKPSNVTEVVKNNMQTVPTVDENMETPKTDGTSGNATSNQLNTFQGVEELSKSKKSQKSNNLKPAKVKSAKSVSCELPKIEPEPGRSKRVKIPNKRYEDSPPPSPHPTKTTATPQKATPKKVVKSPSTSSTVPAVVPATAIKATQKKRSASMSSSDYQNMNGKISKLNYNETAPAKMQQLAEVIVAPIGKQSKGAPVAPASATQTETSGGRSRRQIIPNRKFFSEDEEPSKDMQFVAKKADGISGGEPKKMDVENPKKKRQSSGQTGRKEPLLKPLSLPPPSSVANSAVQGPAKSVTKSKTKKMATEVEAPKSLPQCNGNGSYKPTSDITSNGAKSDNTSPNVLSHRMIDMDQEFPVDESEMKMFQGKPLYLGTCILKESTSDGVTKNSENLGKLICCGVCGQLKKYRILKRKWKRGSFLCTDCGIIVNKIFQRGQESKSFACILGPPICAGWCPLVHFPMEQFCEACFAKACLTSLPIENDVYFKIWRMIPPMSRGGVQPTPTPNHKSPNVGKIVTVDDQGQIKDVTDSPHDISPSTGGRVAEIVKDLNLDSDDSNGPLNSNNNDLNSAAFEVDQRTGIDPTANNFDNSIPEGKAEEPLHISSSLSHNNSSSCVVHVDTPNGVSKEEMLLDRQIGQKEGVDMLMETLIDPILKPEMTGDDLDTETFGFAVIVSGPSYPRKPLCFLCGSAGIEQLIYCSMCCEPYHPYCAGDDLLLDTYIALCNNDELKNSIHEKDKSEDDTDPSKIVLKWICRRCMPCNVCKEPISNKELIRCNRCQNPFHLQSCIDKAVLQKVKDLSKLRKVWNCDECLKCKSCGKKIESNRRVRTIQEAVAAAVSSDAEEEEEETEENEPSSQPNCLMLCLDCFKQKKKGSFCPVCEVCYDDNDWDSKMMECSVCSRWIHSACENLNDEQYNILGKLPEDIEFVCRLCHTQNSPPLWLDAVQSHLIKECSSALRLFEKKALGTLRRKRASISLDEKPSFVCNLFGIQSTSPEETTKKTESEVKSAATEIDASSHETSKTLPRLRSSVRKTISYKEMNNCKVNMRDFVKYPLNIEENYHALKILGVEIFNEGLSVPENEEDDLERPRTPIYNTPVKCFTPSPSKHVSLITDSMRTVLGSVKSLHAFRRSFFFEIQDVCRREEEADVLLCHLNESMQETFPWFEKELENSEPEISLVDTEVSTEAPEDSCFSEMEDDKPEQKLSSITSDPFKEVYWNQQDFFDDRPCVLCGEVGDFPPELCGRLLWCGANEWIHCNCAIWSSEVWEHEDGALQQIGGALNRGKGLRCKLCDQKGATVSCCHSTCKSSYHFLCALKSGCFLFENKTMFCTKHTLTANQKDCLQHDMKVGRKVFVDLDWVHKRGVRMSSKHIKVFVGSLRIKQFGSIVPMSVEKMEWDSTTILIPKNFEAERIFWSSITPWLKSTYLFSTCMDSDGFTNKVQDVGVNIVVNHEEKRANRGLLSIKRFHRWLKKAPKYIDEELVDWLPPCLEEFYKEEEQKMISPDNFSYPLHLKFDHSNKKDKSSPTASSSSSSSVDDNHRRVLNLKTENRLSANLFESFMLDDDLQSAETEGYASSIDSDSKTEIETRSSSSTIRKRRHSTCTEKLRNAPKRQCKQVSPYRSRSKYESPRRKSLRNSYVEKVADSTQLENEKSLINCKRKAVDDDSDSGVVYESSSVASCDEDKQQRCRVNLFGEFDNKIKKTESVSPIKSALNQLTQEEVDSIINDLLFDANGTIPLLDQIGFDGPLTMPEDAACESVSEESEDELTSKKIHAAKLKFSLKRVEKAPIESYNVESLWTKLFNEVSKTRQAHNLGQLLCPAMNKSFPDEYVMKANSFRFLGMSHRCIQYIIEQLPGVVTVCTQHKFRYSRTPFVDPFDIDRPLPVNSTGSSRTEGFVKRKPFDMFGWLASRHRKVKTNTDIVEDTVRSQGLPVAMRFRDLGERVKRRFVVLHSEIHGRGLFSRCDLEKGEMLIEYAGEVIRHSLTDPREKYYESKGIGCYMFRIKTHVIDATMKGNAARFINHSCDPNCEAKTIRILGKDHIIIFALRKIFKGEELTYDYKFEMEDEKIPCSCGAPKCRKFMN